MLLEILYADDIVLIAESMAELQETFHSRKSAIMCEGQIVNLMMTKVKVSKIGQVSVRPSSKKDPCGRKIM